MYACVLCCGCFVCIIVCCIVLCGHILNLECLQSLSLCDAVDFIVTNFVLCHRFAIGSVYVFVRAEQDWVMQAKLTAADGAADDHFGYSVSVHGDQVLVGSSQHDDYTGAFPPLEIHLCQRANSVMG